MDGSAGNGLGHVPAHTPVATSIDQWRSVDGCGSVDVVAHDVVTTSTAACPLGRAVTLVTIDGAGHQWPGSTKQRSNLGRAIGGDAPSTALDATRMIWDFFEAHPGPG